MKQIEIGKKYSLSIPFGVLSVHHPPAWAQIGDAISAAEEDDPRASGAYRSLISRGIFSPEETAVRAIAVVRHAAKTSDGGNVWHGRQRPELFRRGGTVVRQLFEDDKIYEVDLTPVASAFRPVAGCRDAWVKSLVRAAATPPTAFASPEHLSPPWDTEELSGYCPDSPDIVTVYCFPPSDELDEGTTVADGALGGKYSVLACLMRSLSPDDDLLEPWGGESDGE